jgi:hypothetical protein
MELECRSRDRKLTEYFTTNGRWKIDEYLKYYPLSPVTWECQDICAYTVNYNQMEAGHFYDNA